MMRRHVLFAAMITAGVAMASSAAMAAEIRIINADANTNKGLDDKTPATPIGGNPGTTRGQQALIVYQFAADMWGSVLQSKVPVLTQASFQPLSCTATSGTLGSAGTNLVFSFNAPAPAGAQVDTWYHSALTDALAGSDAGVENGYDANEPDIISRFNGNLGTPGCLETSGWYFGLDGKTPAGQINFLNVVMHEIAHGLGFSGFNSLASGAQFNGQKDIYSTFVKDNTTGKAWTAMTDAERVTSALNDGHLVFTGTNVKAEAPLALKPLIAFNVTAPAAIAGSYDFSTAAYGAEPAPSNFSGPVALAGSDACAAVTTHLTGKVALVDRGTCAFVIKSKNLQTAGATAVIIANNAAGTISPSGVDDTVTIPTIAITQADGATFKANVGAGLAVAFQPDPQNRLAGGDGEGNVQLYAPTVLAQGSSFSHYDTRLTPNAIMEYAINADLIGQIDLDLTPALFKDEGWKLNETTQSLLTCNTGIPTWLPGGTVVGANVVSNLTVQAAAAANLAAYKTAALDYARTLASSGFITAAQATSLNACLSDNEIAKQYAAWGTPPPPSSVVLANGVGVGNQAGAPAGEITYSLVVPAGAKQLSLRSYGGTGDVSLYVKKDAVPTSTSFDFSSVRTGNTEGVTVAAPAAGTYYLKVVGVKAFSGVTVLGSFVAPK